jgi:hypothetical protein
MYVGNPAFFKICLTLSRVINRISAIRIAGRVGSPSLSANTFWELVSAAGGSNDI